MSNSDAGQTNLVLVQRICDRCVLKATIEATRPYVYGTIEEVPQGKWGLTGHPLLRSGFPHQHQRSRADLRACRQRVFNEGRRAHLEPI
jgi:hypothetical protein